MMIERLLIAALFLAAGAVVVFERSEAEFLLVWLAGAALGLWITYRVLRNRKRH